MELGMIGLGRMGASMVRRLMRAGHTCVVFDRVPEVAQALAHEGAVGAATLDEFVKRLSAPRAIWMMVPAAVLDQTIADLAPLTPNHVRFRLRPEFTIALGATVREGGERERGRNLELIATHEHDGAETDPTPNCSGTP